MIALRTTLNRLRADKRGAAIVETAITAPILALMALGSYDISKAVSRQTELQNAAGQAVEIALATPPETTQQQTTLRNILRTTTGLTDSHVMITMKYRCGANTSLVGSSSNCDSGVSISKYLEVKLTDTYTPQWTAWGVGKPISLDVTRMVMIGAD